MTLKSYQELLRLGDMLRFIPVYIVQIKYVLVLDKTNTGITKADFTLEFTIDCFFKPEV